MQINFQGESGIDAGGVFREGVAVMAADLFSDHFNLFILCPNGQHETHHNCDKYVPCFSFSDPAFFVTTTSLFICLPACLSLLIYS